MPQSLVISDGQIESMTKARCGAIARVSYHALHRSTWRLGTGNIDAHDDAG